MSALMQLGDTRAQAARKVARAAGKWDCMEGAAIDHVTVANWRDGVRAEAGSRQEQYHRMVDDLLSGPTPASKIEQLLKSGPPGIP
jgi:hypothetical protein